MPFQRPQVSAKSAQRGFFDSIKAIFFARVQPFIASRDRRLYEHRQSSRNIPAGRNDTCWQILPPRRACVTGLGDKCCSSCRYIKCQIGCTRCKRSTHDPSCLFHKPVILSEVSVRRSELSPRNDSIVRTPCRVRLTTFLQGVLRLRGCSASRSIHSAQDDNSV